MKVLYVGHYKPGCTTRMRGEHLQDILKPSSFRVVDMDPPIDATPKLFRSIGWRYYKGPLVRNINRHFEDHIRDDREYDLVWIDKGVFIDPDLLGSLKRTGNKLVHYTPDTAFLYNRSPLFLKGIRHYDHCITTKSFELDAYRDAGTKGLLYCTQGYDPDLHKPCHAFPDKKGIVFIGQYEPWRGRVCGALLEAGFHVTIAGEKWTPFVRRHSGLPNFRYLGRGLFQQEYVQAISGAQVSLGLLSKKFPEKHTTRTFEIPACGTLLATEGNEETHSFFTEEEAVFFREPEELVDRLRPLFSDPAKLEAMTGKGRERVLRDGYDYRSILVRLNRQMGLL